jgi:hypothetical protein
MSSVVRHCKADTGGLKIGLLEPACVNVSTLRRQKLLKFQAVCSSEQKATAHIEERPRVQTATWRTCAICVTCPASCSVTNATFCIGGSQARKLQPKAEWPVSEYRLQSSCQRPPPTFHAHARGGGRRDSTTTSPHRVECDECILTGRSALEARDYAQARLTGKAMRH